ncbi:MAG: universal stress protein [Flavobacteriaceae bacterium]
MKNILVAVDFDNKEEQLLAKAVEFSKAFSAKICLIHVAALSSDPFGYGTDPEQNRNFRAKELKVEHRRLEKYSKDLEAKGIEAIALLVQGSTVNTILDQAKSVNADLIIAGYEEHSFFYEALIGSVSAKAVRKSKIPLLIVPLN